MFTIPNFISTLRAIGVPIFLWVYLGLDQKGWALLILMLGGVSDYLDGKLARYLNQSSELGAKLDPAIDRFYLVAILCALAYRHVLPTWVVVLLVGRDVFLALLLLIKGKLLKVTYLGKAATFNLLYALPFLLLNQYQLTRIFGWSFAIWGIGLYLLTGIGYSRVALSDSGN
jgi:cardiolipin synthase (CMP-forming)